MGYNYKMISRLFMLSVVLCFFVVPFSYADDDSAKERKIQRKAKERAEQVKLREDTEEGSHRIDNKIISSRDSGVKINDQKYVSSVIAREREEFKEDATLREEEELRKAQKAAAQQKKNIDEENRIIRKKKQKQLQFVD